MKVAIFFLGLFATVFGASGYGQFSEQTPTKDRVESMVEVYRYGTHSSSTRRCFGALIDPQWVLIPATCLATEKIYMKLRVHVGSEKINIVEYLLHEKAKLHANDIALLKLETPVKAVSPIKLASKNTTIPSDFIDVLVRTDGGIERVDKLSTKPRDSKCVMVLRYTGPITEEGNICAGGYQYRLTQDMAGCLMVVNDPNEGTLLVGQFVFGKRKADDYFYPALFTRLSHYTEWIKGKINKV